MAVIGYTFNLHPFSSLHSNFYPFCVPYTPILNRFDNVFLIDDF